MDGTARGRRDAARRALLAASISSLLSLAAAEAVCRRVFGVPLRERLPILEVRPNPRRGFEMVPDRDHYTYQHPVHVNHLGLRGRDLPDKTEDEVRVLCLGDSTTYGQGVAEADTLPVLLEKSLSQNARASTDETRPPRTIHVINGGLRAYGTLQELALLQDLAGRIRPDVVVLLWYPNDVERPAIARKYENLARSGPIAFDTEARMEGLPLALWRAKQVLRSSALIMEVHDFWAGMTFPRLTPEQIERGFVRLDHDLGQFGDLARTHGFDFAVATIPTSGALRGAGEADPIAGRVGELARAHGFAFVDLTADLRALVRSIGRLPILPYDGHYTGEANATMALRLAALLREKFPGRL
jgi:hypothetical protein